MNAMKHFWLLALIVAPLAHAAGIKKPAGVIGNAKEDELVCPPAPVTDAPSEAALLRALGFAFESTPIEIRSQAIEDLGLLGDPRALNLLATLSLDANPAVSKAAVRAIGLFHHPRAEEILSNLVRLQQVPLATRQQALALLPFQNTITAVRLVHFTARDRMNPAQLVQQARTLIAQFKTESK